MKGMISRRCLVLTGLLIATAAPLARAEPVTSDDPVAIITAIYTRAAKGKGDGGGAFVIENKAAKAKYLSKSLVHAVGEGGCAYAKGRRRARWISILSPIRRSRMSNPSRWRPKNSTPPGR